MMQWPMFLVYIACLALVSTLGFLAHRWNPDGGWQWSKIRHTTPGVQRQAGDHLKDKQEPVQHSVDPLDQLDEWALVGRRLSTLPLVIVIGGTLFTAYTYVAVPALLYSSGAIGFFAIPYSVLANLVMYTIMPRYWDICRRNNYVTAADFVLGHFHSRSLALAVAVTGILATIPYIALQIFGIEVALAQMGVAPEVPLIFTFMLLTAYTYVSGMRASLLVATLKAVMISVTVIIAIVLIPPRLGGFGAIFTNAATLLRATRSGALLLQPADQISFATLALGSVLALFLYPHTQTAVLCARSARDVRRGALWLPLFSLILTLLALLGYAALAAGIPQDPLFKANVAIPALFAQAFPTSLAGFALTAIAIGALVPAAIMSMAAANLFTRNIYGAYLQPHMTAREESNVAKLTTLVIKVAALALVIFTQESGVIQQIINFQLLGGVWILQTLPTVFLGMLTNWFSRRALLVGWGVSMLAVTWMVLAQHPISTNFPLPVGFGSTAIVKVYAGLVALLLNVAIAFVGTLVAHRLAVRGHASAQAVSS